MAKKLVIVGVVLILAAWLTHQMFSLAQTECSLCVTFNQVKKCVKALGPTEKEALDEAHRNACAQLASGVTETLACGNIPAEEVSCQAR